MNSGVGDWTMLLNLNVHFMYLHFHQAMRGSLVLTKLKAEGVKDFSGLGALRSKYENEEVLHSLFYASC
jgi:hypothetical protein